MQLQLWDEVITCYHLLELRHKAAEVIRDQIEKDGESATLLCMLGDATDDPDYYQKVIEMSNGRSARAFRSVGTYFFNTERSGSSKIKNRSDKVPGKWRSCEIDLQY